VTQVLIVDDDRVNLALVREVMLREGFTVIEATSGEEAVSLAMQASPDLIVMDIMMPGMGGISALSQLRNQPRTQHIPVIALTAMAMPDDCRKLLDCGFNAYVSKPIRVQDFSRQVQALLEEGVDHD